MLFDPRPKGSNDHATDLAWPRYGPTAASEAPDAVTTPLASPPSLSSRWVAQQCETAL